jgi:hypothetical protein
MQDRNRELLVLLKTPSLSGEALEKHLECLHNVLVRVEYNDVFCNAHELVTRFRIKNRKQAIIKAISSSRLKPFHFLLNKN